MISKSILKIFKLILLVGIVCYVSNCGKNPTDPTINQTPSASESITTAAIASGSDLYQTVNSANRALMMMNGMESCKYDKAISQSNMVRGLATSTTILKQFHTHASNHKASLSKTLSPEGEAILWDFRWRDSKAGISYHAVLYYNDQTGHARAYYVAYDFAERYDLMYDSTNAEYNVNFTLEDSTDDVLLKFDNLKNYKPAYYIRSEETHYTPDDTPAGQETDGGKVEVTTIYAGFHDIAKKYEFFESHAENEGLYLSETWYPDNSYSSQEISYHPDGQGHYYEVKRDGTHITATFDDASLDGEGSFHVKINYPVGHDPVLESQVGNFTFNLIDSTLNGSFSEATEYLDGHTDSTGFIITQSLENDIKTTRIDAENSNGEKAKVTLIESPDKTLVNAEWTDKDGIFMLFDGWFYPDNRAIIDVNIYASRQAYENGDEPLFTGHFEFNPDGSGAGALTSAEDSYKVKISPDGSSRITG